LTPPAEPGNADARYSLGLLLVRQHDYAGALELLRQAHELVPDNARYAYVYAVALNSTGASAEAMASRSTIHCCWPNRSRRSTTSPAAGSSKERSLYEGALSSPAASTMAASE
jgi:tetratricopeptide (TPR) repeat protein